MIFVQRETCFTLLEQLVANFADLTGDLQSDFRLLSGVAFRNWILVVWIVFIDVTICTCRGNDKGRIGWIKLTASCDRTRRAWNVA